MAVLLGLGATKCCRLRNLGESDWRLALMIACSVRQPETHDALERFPSAACCSSSTHKSESPAPGRGMRGFQGGQARGGGRGRQRRCLVSAWVEDTGRAQAIQVTGCNSVSPNVSRRNSSLDAPRRLLQRHYAIASYGSESPRQPGTVHAWLGFSASTERFETSLRQVLNARDMEEAPGITLGPRPNSPERWPRNDARSR
jgi:hypothetical protein